MAQQYFSQCRDKLIELIDGDDSNGDDSNGDVGGADDFRVELPNQKADNEISLGILDEKISGLRFSDVCSEAQRLFEAGDHDQVVSVLLGHFFPANQAPRMMDFLNEFEVDEDDPAARGGSSKSVSKWCSTHCVIAQSIRMATRYCSC